jgi:hypothetical protein
MVMTVIEAHMDFVKGLINDHALLLDRAGTTSINPVSEKGSENSTCEYLLATIATSPTTASNF